MIGPDVFGHNPAEPRPGRFEQSVLEKIPKPWHRKLAAGHAFVPQKQKPENRARQHGERPKRCLKHLVFVPDVRVFQKSQVPGRLFAHPIKARALAREPYSRTRVFAENTNTV